MIPNRQLRCKACRSERYGIKYPHPVSHTCGKDDVNANPKDDLQKLKLEELKKTIEIIHSGYAGVMPNGNIVDRRGHPEAVPIPENAMFNTPPPKDIN